MLRYKLKIALSIVLLSFLACSSLKQKSTKSYIHYYASITKADSLYRVNEYQKSYTILNALSQSYEMRNTPTINEYHTYLKSAFLTNKKINNTVFSKVITKFGLAKSDLEYDSVLKKVYDYANISDKKYEEYRKKYQNKIDFELRNKILSLKTLDQEVRKKSNKTDAEIQNQDKKSEKLLIELFDKGIYPNQEIVGNHTLDKKHASISILLLHTKDSMRLHYFLPKIKQFIKEGKCYPKIYANMVDQYHLYNDLDQVYGTFSIFDINKEDYFKFNSKRSEIGVSSIEYSLWKYGILMSSLKN